jgi:hypothetical protein
LGYAERVIKTSSILYILMKEESTQRKLELIQRRLANALEFKNRWVCKGSSIKWLVWSAIADQPLD